VFDIEQSPWTNYIDTKSKRNFAAGVYLSEAQTQARAARGGVEQERRLEGQQLTKLGLKYHHD
jgi:hypothetical protein